MKVLRVLSPTADAALADSVRVAVTEFNGALDIRLRFLSIGIEDEELRVTDAESAARDVGERLDAGAPGVVLVQGDDVAALAAVTVAARCPAVVAHLGAGRRDGPDADTARAIDRLCSVLLALAVEAARTLDDEGLGERTTLLATCDGADGDALGGDVIRALREARLRQRGGQTC